MHAEQATYSRTMRSFIATAAVLGWAGLSIQLYLILYGRWSYSVRSCQAFERRRKRKPRTLADVLDG